MFELSLLCPEDRVDIVSEALEALDALSVSVEDADAQTPAEQALFGEPGMPPPKEGWQCSRVVALFAQESVAQEAAVLLGAQDFFEQCEIQGIQALEDHDWVRLTQSQFAPVEVSSDFWIVPTWHEPPAQARQIAPRHARHVAPEHVHGPAARQACEIKQRQQRRFSRPRRPGQKMETAGLQREAHVAQHFGPQAVAQAHLLKDDHLQGGCWHARARRRKLAPVPSKAL